MPLRLNRILMLFPSVTSLQAQAKEMMLALVSGVEVVINY